MDFKTEAGKKLLDERTTKLGVSYFIRETWLGELCPPVIEAQYAVFSLNFCSAGKGPFIGGKAKKKCMPEAHFPGEGR